VLQRVTMHTRNPRASNGDRRSRIRWLIGLTIATLATSAPLSAKRKDDKLVLLNGDRLIGEIRELAQGELHFKTDYILNEFHVDWAQIQELESQDIFRVALKDGRRLTGTITKHTGGEFIIAGAAGAIVASVTWSDVLTMTPVETSFWAQLTGQVNSGFSYTSGNSETQFSASGSLGYVADRYAFDLTGSSIFSGHSGDGGSTSTSRNTVELLNEFPIAPRWFAGALAGLLNSDQQDLRLRTTAGAGVGRWLAPTEHVGVTVFGGLVYTHEQYLVSGGSTSSDTQVADNLEAVTSLRFTFHRFKTADVESNATVYPSLSSIGRVRLSVAPTLNIEIARNLYWNFTLYENYDSRPPVNANKNDFGVTNSIGWKF
jgi:putative salt-induced outer membrane protein YdiY